MTRRAYALATLLQQVNKLHPIRDTGSDGWIGDARHRQRPSSHNPNRRGVVRAQDFDEDNRPGDEHVGSWLWPRLIAARDPRMTYAIYEGELVSSYPAHGYPAWTPRPYTGPNPHLTHLHVSVADDPRLYDDPAVWNLHPQPQPEPEDDMRLVQWDNKIWLIGAGRPQHLSAPAKQDLVAAGLVSGKVHVIKHKDAWRALLGEAS